MDLLRRQVKTLGLGNVDRVVALCGKRYAARVEALWPGKTETPLFGVGGLGKQMAFLKRYGVR